METNAILDGCSHCTAGALSWDLLGALEPSQQLLPHLGTSESAAPVLPYLESCVNNRDITRALLSDSWCWLGVDGGELLPTLLFQGSAQPVWTQLKKVMDLKVSAPGILGKGEAPLDSF